MRARDYAPVEALQTEPSGPHVRGSDRVAALADALRGVDLGAYDHRIVGWMAGMLDDPTLRVIVSLLERARAAGIEEGAAVDHALRQRFHVTRGGYYNSGPQ